MDMYSIRVSCLIIRLICILYLFLQTSDSWTEAVAVGIEPGLDEVGAGVALATGPLDPDDHLVAVPKDDWD